MLGILLAYSLILVENIIEIIMLWDYNRYTFFPLPFVVAVQVVVMVRIHTELAV